MGPCRATYLHYISVSYFMWHSRNGKISHFRVCGDSAGGGEVQLTPFFLPKPPERH